jgi:2-polyprenyl-6-methoxyphenol hydroxylase-like FAD-dependent oxidoreductase
MPALGKVLIVGGGIAGMTLAIGLTRAGIYAEIVEINPQWTVLGVGISLQGPALRAFKMIDLLDRCMEIGFGYSHFKACDAEGNVTATVQMPRLNGPDYPAAMGVMRQALHLLLKQVLAEAQVPVRLGVTVLPIHQDDSSIGVQFTDGTAGRYDLVVGADGANSKIRDMLFGVECRPKYTGQAVWRATLNRPPDVQGRCSFFGPRNKAGFNPVSNKQMYVYLVQNLPEFVRIADDRLPEVMREQLADFGGIIASVRDHITDPNEIVYRSVASNLLPTPWYRGRAILIGDAAHTATPHMAAGAGIAIEDSIVLTELLQSAQSVARALENFMTRRFERCRLVVENSFMLGEWEKVPNLPGADPAGVLDRSLKALAQPF